MLACIPNKTTIKISMDSLFWNRQWSETINAYYHDCCCYYQPSPRVCNLAYCQLVPSPSKLLMSWQEEHPVQNIGAEHWILSNLWGCCKPLSGQTARGKSGRVQSNQHGTVKKNQEMASNRCLIRLIRVILEKCPQNGCCYSYSYYY